MNVIWISIIGWTATVLIFIANVAQTIKVIRTKTTSGLSLYTYSFLLIGVILWMVYGILTSDIPLITFNATNFIAILITFIVTTRNRIRGENNEKHNST